MVDSEVLRAATFLLWEAVILAFSFRLGSILTTGHLRYSLALGISLLLESIAASGISFSRLNETISYLILLLLISVAYAWLFRGRGPGVDRQTSLQPNFPTFGWAILFAVLLGIVLRPVEEVDSLYNLHYVAGWISNLATPYSFAFNFVPVWELSFVPQLVLGKSDLFFWWNGAKAVAFLGLMLWAIAEELKIGRSRAAWLIPSLLLFPHLWIGPSGLTTLKNDMFYAAGQAALFWLALVYFRRGFALAHVVLLTVAVVFVSVKFSGPVFLVLSATAFVLLFFKRPDARQWLVPGLWIGVVWLIAAGHYYLRNYLAFGNPMYPFTLSLGPIYFPGRGDLSGTSILHSLHDQRLWQAFLAPDNGVSPAGAMFPLFFPCLLILFLCCIVRAIVRRCLDQWAILGILQSLAWLVYMRSIYSASGWPGDLQMVLNNLNSLRYIEGPLLIGEIMLFRLLPLPLAASAFGIHGLSRVWIILERAGGVAWFPPVVLGLATAGALVLLWKSRNRMLRLAVVSMPLLLASVFVELRRPLWLPTLKPIYERLYAAPGQEVHLVINDEFSQQPCARFPLLGRWMQHRVTAGPLSDAPASAAYIVWTRGGTSEPSPMPMGYSLLVTTQHGVLLQRQP